MRKTDVTIVLPWLSRSDWTGIILDDLIRILESIDIKYNIVIGYNLKSNRQKAFLSKPFSFLYPKLAVIDKLVSLARQGRLANNLIFIDSSFVNLKAARYLIGEKGQIVCLVNGGSFQEHDLDLQFMSQRTPDILRAEEGHYFLADKIILPSQYAFNKFISAFPDLKSRAVKAYYYLPSNFGPDLNFIKKKGIVFSGRPSFEKGEDILRELNFEGANIEVCNGFHNSIFRQKLKRYKSLLVPSRADFFGFSALEAIIAGTIPIVPKGLSYEELVCLPANLKLSFPIGKNSIKEVQKIINIIEQFDKETYESIIMVARNHLNELLGDYRNNLFGAITDFLYAGRK